MTTRKDMVDFQSYLSNLENNTYKGQANGYASLDGTGKVPVAQLPSSIVGGLNYQGTWNASTNSPTITSGSGTKGFYYKVSVAGSTAIDTVSQWEVGDFIAYNGATWDRIDGGSSEVVSVFGRTGAVSLQSSDVTTALGFTPYNSTNPSSFQTAGQVSASISAATSSINAATVSVGGAAGQSYYMLLSYSTGSGNTPVASSSVTFNNLNGTLSATSFSGSGANLTNLPAGQLTGTVPAAALPTATTSALGGVKVDGSSVTINGSGVISAVGSAPTTTASISTWTGTPYDVTGSTFGVPTASQTDIRFTTGRAFTLPINLAGSVVKAAVAATASTAILIQKNGSTVATITFAAAGTTATFSNQAAISYAIGDKFSIVAPASPDATLADIDYFILASLS